ncbi:MAG: hypothetical protein ABEJ40_06800 [Haloarculaceae archaeon]
MGAEDERRLYGERRAETVAYLAAGQGVATVRVGGDQVGRFGLAHRCRARDVATAEGTVYVAADDGILVGPGEAGGDGRDSAGAPSDSDGFRPLGFDGAAVAVTTRADAVLAADNDGAVSRYRDGAWEPVGGVGEVRALSGDLVAASDGVYRVDGDELVGVGLSDARDVAADGVPLAATGDGLYRLGNGWLCEREGRFAVVAAATDATERVHAATDETLFARDDGGWRPVDLPVEEPVVDVAYGQGVYAVTRRGTFLTRADPEATADGTGGWRHRSLGLPDAAAVAVA